MGALSRREEVGVGMSEGPRETVGKPGARADVGELRCRSNSLQRTPRTEEHVE